MPGIRRFTEDEEDKITRLYTEKGFTAAEIARLMGCGPTPVLRVLRDREAPIRPQGNELKASRNQRIITLSEEGHDHESIAKSIGVSRQRVHQIVTRGY